MSRLYSKDMKQYKDHPALRPCRAPPYGATQTHPFHIVDDVYPTRTQYATRPAAYLPRC